MDRLSSPDPAPLPAPAAPHPRYPRRPSDSSGSNPDLHSGDSDPEPARQPADSPVYVPREVAFPERVTRSGRVSRPPRRDPYTYPLCAMAFPPKIPSLMSLSPQSNPRGHMCDRRSCSVYPVDQLDAAPSANPALQPAPAQRYPLCPGPSLPVEPCMLPLDPYSAYGHSHPSRRAPLPPVAHDPAPPPAAAGQLASSIHPRPPKWPQSFALGGLVYVWSSRDGAYYDHTGRSEFPYDSPPDDALIGSVPATATPPSRPTPIRRLGDRPRDRAHGCTPHHSRARFRLMDATCYLCGVRGHLARSCPGPHGSSATRSDISAWSLSSDGSSSQAPSPPRLPKRRPCGPLPGSPPASPSLPSVSPFIGPPSAPYLGALPAPNTPQVQPRYVSALPLPQRPWLHSSHLPAPATNPMPRTCWPPLRASWPHAECVQVQPSTRPCEAAVSGWPYAAMAGAPRVAPMSSSRRESRSGSPLNSASMMVTPTPQLDSPFDRQSPPVASHSSWLRPRALLAGLRDPVPCCPHPAGPR